MMIFTAETAGITSEDGTVGIAGTAGIATAPGTAGPILIPVSIAGIPGIVGTPGGLRMLSEAGELMPGEAPASVALRVASTTITAHLPGEAVILTTPFST